MSTENDLASKEQRGKRLRTLRYQLRYSRRELCEKYDISDSSLQNWEDARYKGLNNRAAELMADIYRQEGFTNCTAAWLLYGVGQEPGHPFLHPQLPMNNTINKELQLFHELNPGCIDMRIPDNTLAPYYCQGDWIAGKRYVGQDMQQTVGLIAMVETVENQFCIRLVVEAVKDNTFIVKQLNPQNPINTTEKLPLLSSAPILWLRRSPH